ncbi:hypothetical protein EGM51_13295 [Verrucomicrobia bacterium S94]|nr:hypothetical protein EGM51_13295 [Verrucomicrobia bacterium S94]
MLAENTEKWSTSSYPTDEAISVTGELDLDLSSAVKELAAEGKTVVVVLHDLIAAARYADRLVAMKDGKLVAEGKPSDIVSSNLVQTLYGIESTIVTAPDDGAPVVIAALEPNT